MNVMDHEPLVEEQRKVRRHRSRRVLAGLTAAVAAAVVLAGALALGPGGEAGSDVSVGPTGPTPTTVTPSSEPPTAPGATEGPQATPLPTVQPVPTTAAPTPPLAPAPERLTSASRLRLDGIGPIQVGMTLAEATVAAGVPVRIDPRTDLGRGCAHAFADGGPQGVRFMVVDGRIVRIEVIRSSILTLSGVGTGSTVDEVLATYPNRIRVQPNPYSGHLGGRDLLYVTDEASSHLGLMFETDGHSVRTFRSGFLGAVMAPEGCS
ncbi:MAG: hypothetical protein M3450_16775 [Actinomycetota bacterium]|nr:hypothetical protein [Actinomycetota bacterium]